MSLVGMVINVDGIRSNNHFVQISGDLGNLK
jgi:hypothetical protein